MLIAGLRSLAAVIDIVFVLVVVLVLEISDICSLGQRNNIVGGNRAHFDVPTRCIEDEDEHDFQIPGFV